MEIVVRVIAPMKWELVDAPVVGMSELGDVDAIVGESGDFVHSDWTQIYPQDILHLEERPPVHSGLAMVAFAIDGFAYVLTEVGIGYEKDRTLSANQFR
jgi:hypothetical protein